MYNCRILADSVNTRGHRLTSFCVTYPRFIHPEFLTHAMLCRNGESSRARPVLKNIEDVRLNPFIPEAFGQNQPGMQFENVLDDQSNNAARDLWLYGVDQAIWVAGELAKLDVHKSHANRVQEPYKWYTAIYTGTDWGNFFALRTHKDAQKEFQIIALMMQEAYLTSEPRLLSSGEWHTPFVSLEEIQEESMCYSEPFIDWELWQGVSVGRCARVSYLTHDGKRDLNADLDLRDKLLTAKPHHMSPFGHVARPFSSSEWALVERIEDAIWAQEGHTSDLFLNRMLRNIQYCAQYRGWWSARADILHEDDASKLLEDY